MKYAQKVFANESLELDGNEFDRCTFRSCELKYNGGELPVLNGCHFDASPFIFEKQAGNTLAMLRAMYHAGLGQLVESLFDDLRRNPPS
ncbi:MAG TPA: hypothetical protein VHL85_05985 [Burkholderiales bacterium]|jgi:hypothetical protein|nr:hypothetical protein [Burkholderiales bacterium]